MKPLRRRLPSQRTSPRFCLSRFCSASLCLATLGLALFGVLSCGEDKQDDTIVGPLPNAGPPVLPLPGLAVDPAFLTENSRAETARRVVNGQINMIGLVSRPHEGTISTLNTRTWNPVDESCWSKSLGDPLGQGGCSYTLWVCPRGLGYEWSEIVDSTCPYGFGTRDYEDWVAVRGSTSISGGIGTFRVFDGGTEGILRAWTWRLTESSGEWRFFDGEAEEPNLVATLLWTKGADGFEHSEWLWPGNGKWESRISANGHAGEMTVHRWEADQGSWRRSDAITWDEGHGSWKSYDRLGVIHDEEIW